MFQSVACLCRSQYYKVNDSKCDIRYSGGSFLLWDFTATDKLDELRAAM